MSFTNGIRRHSRPLGLALALPVFLAFGAMDALAQEEQETQERHTEQETEFTDGQDLLSTAEGIEEISLFVQALHQSGLAEALKGEEQFTLLAPTNAAMSEHFSDEELERYGLHIDKDKAEKDIERDRPMEKEYDPMERSEDELDRTEDDDPRAEDEARQERTDKQQRMDKQQLTQADRQELVRLVRAHIVIGEYPTQQLRTVEHVHNVLGEELAVRDETEPAVAIEDREREEREEPWEEARDIEPAADEELDLQISDAEVVRADISAANGVIHVIDAVIEPQEEIFEDEDPTFEDERDSQEDERDWQDEPVDDYDPDPASH